MTKQQRRAIKACIEACKSQRKALERMAAHEWSYRYEMIAGIIDDLAVAEARLRYLLTST